MLQYTRNLTVAEWLVIAAMVFIVGTFSSDEVRSHYATKQGMADAERDIKLSNFQFRIGGCGTCNHETIPDFAE
jgi:hypothetical protein